MLVLAMAPPLSLGMWEEEGWRAQSSAFHAPWSDFEPSWEVEQPLVLWTVQSSVRTIYLGRPNCSTGSWDD